ncbi:protoporphyrinogen oxidase [Nocardioides terrisoli]|uniref:protoporphyrinogen oxidase n=1 Tax=Nocardioides terrisoli TaxID=3388267 RepID=UPI00287B75D3|nr:protoporphyrinogen oxidase [Nocardioides marmorisolisilvae]
MPSESIRAACVDDPPEAAELVAGDPPHAAAANKAVSAAVMPSARRARLRGPLACRPEPLVSLMSMAVRRSGSATGSRRDGPEWHSVRVSASGRSVVVVGGGISGLAAALALRERLPDAEITVLEGAPRIGGKLQRAEVGGVTVDVGAEAMLNRRPEATALARAVGLADELVHPLTTTAYLWNRNRLVPMPRTLMGVPGDAKALDGVLSRAGQARAALEPRLPATELAGADISIGRLVEERFGKEVVDRLVEPLLGGVYAGHAREISARAAVPQVVALLEKDRSLTRAAAAALAVPAGEVPVFAGIRGGLGRLPEAVAAASGATVLTGSTARDLARRTDGGWHVVVGETRDPRLVAADAVVLATPARPTARLLSDVAPTAALELARIDYASMAIVTLAFPAHDFPPVGGSGFLAPPVDGHVVKAATFSHQKWNWVAQAGRRGDGADVAVMRCSIGRHGEEEVLQVGDEDLVAAAVADLGRAIGLSVAPVDSHVQRWGGALPQYTVGHLDRIATVRADLEGVTGLAVCGAAYDGLGLPACIGSARRAADKVVADLRAREASAS